MRLFRILYFSENHLDYDRGSLSEQLGSILEVSQSNNERDGISGALMFDDLWFIQALEGDRDAVWKSVDRIRGDGRHRQLTIVNAQDIESRSFERWSMTLITRNNFTRQIMDTYSREGRMNVKDMVAEDFLKVLSILASNKTKETA
jgi:hypothetical protein